MTSSYTTDVAVLCITSVCLIPSSLSRMLKKPLRSLTVRRSVETALSRVLRMKTSVKMYPQLLRVKQRGLQRPVSPANMNVSTSRAVSLQRISKQEQELLSRRRCPLQASFTTGSTGASTGRAT